MLYKVVMYDPDTGGRIINDLIEYTGPGDIIEYTDTDGNVKFTGTAESFNKLLGYVGKCLDAHGWTLGQIITMPAEQLFELEVTSLYGEMELRYDDGQWQTIRNSIHITSNLDY